MTGKMLKQVQHDIMLGVIDLLPYSLKVLLPNKITLLAVGFSLIQLELL